VINSADDFRITNTGLLLTTKVDIHSQKIVSTILGWDLLAVVFFMQHCAVH